MTMGYKGMIVSPKDSERASAAGIYVKDWEKNAYYQAERNGQIGQMPADESFHKLIMSSLY